jgi:uncharacterized protein with HEPN domain
MALHSARVWLVDICGEIAGIRELIGTCDLEIFANNWAMKRAVEHALLIVAEAAKHLPPEMKDSHPDVPWQKIHGLGNLLRHEYRRIDPEVLWSIVTEHLDGVWPEGNV